MLRLRARQLLRPAALSRPAARRFSTGRSDGGPDGDDLSFPVRGPDGRLIWKKSSVPREKAAGSPSLTDKESRLRDFYARHSLSGTESAEPPRTDSAEPSRTHSESRLRANREFDARQSLTGTDTPDLILDLKAAIKELRRSWARVGRFSDSYQKAPTNVEEKPRTEQQERLEAAQAEAAAEAVEPAAQRRDMSYFRRTETPRTEVRRSFHPSGFSVEKKPQPAVARDRGGFTRLLLSVVGGALGVTYLMKQAEEQKREPALPLVERFDIEP